MHYSFNELVGIPSVRKKIGQRVPVVIKCRVEPQSRLSEIAAVTADMLRSQSKAKRSKNRYLYE